MDTFVIEGGRRLEGRVRINGAKNAALPLMAAALLTGDRVTIRDVPPLADIRNMERLLAELGCHRLPGEDDACALQSMDEACSHARYDVVRTMRASICVLGPLLARRGSARISLPGGCSIGERPVDLHLRGLAAMGAQITLKSGDILATAPGGRLRGARIFLGGSFGSTVLGTANIMSAACLAEGTTIIESAACEPEVVDLARMLTAMGADIEGAGSPRITVRGVAELRGTDHRVIADRIEAGTFMCAAAITNGNLILENCPLDYMMAVCDRLEAAGVHMRTMDETGRPCPEPVNPARANVRVTCDRLLKPVEITTQPHPGFPTDLQAQLMSLLTLAEGNSVITEKVFPERFLHVAELTRMGARIFRQGPTVVVSGVRHLVGAPVMASDLRASASLVLAGLAAEGSTVVNRVYHLDRGYERMEERLNSLGAAIRRVDEKELAEDQRAIAV
ncbi:MAG: UDP-N-acetylglucosamine 1-carboxyvinyltransferase [Phycisphaerales bacterium]